MRAQLYIGPDDANGGIAWRVEFRGPEGDLSEGDCGGWAGRGPRDRTNPDAWLALARRRIRLPIGVTCWDTGHVAPYGWSQGAGHAPNGIVITWECK